MSINNYDIIFTADTTGAIGNIGHLEAALHRVGTAAQQANAQITDASTGINQMAAQSAIASQPIAQVTSGIGSMTSALLSLSSVIQVVEAVGMVLQQFGEKANQARDHVRELTDDAMALRDSLREVANLMNKTGPDNEVAADVLKLGMESGMMPKDAKKFMEQYLGAIPAGKSRGNITDKTAEDLAVEGAGFATRIGISPATAGVFTGLMSQYQKIPTVEEGAKVLGQVAYGLNEGVGNVEPLLRTLNNTAGSVVELGGPMENLSELAVMEGVASTHANPYATGTRLKQAVRALRETKGDQGKWLADHGVEDGMSHLDRLKAIKPAIMAEVAKGKGTDQVLKEFVTADDTEARSLTEQLGDVDLMDTRLAKMRTITGKEVMAKNKDYFRADRSGVRRIEQARQAANDFMIGQKNEDMEIAKGNSEMVMRDAGELGGTYNQAAEVLGDWFGIRTNWLGQEGSKEIWKREKAHWALVAEGRRAGMTEADILKAQGLDPALGMKEENGKKVPISAQESDFFTRKNLWEAGEARVKDSYRGLGTAVERRGGNVFGADPKVAKKLDNLVAEGKETNRILRQNNKAGAAANAPAKPAAAGNLVKPRAVAAVAPKRP